MMHWIDIAILVVLSLTLLFGLWRGLINELFAIVAWIAAILMARIFSSDVGSWLSGSIESQPVLMILSWVIPFVSAFIMVNIIRLIIKSMVDFVGLKPVDRLFGGVFGLLKGGLIITAIVLVAQLAMNKPNQAFATDARFLPHFQAMSLWLLKSYENQSFVKLEDYLPDTKIGETVNDTLASSAALYLGLDRSEVENLLKHMNIEAQELAKQLNDPEKLESLRELLSKPEIQALLNQGKD